MLASFVQDPENMSMRYLPRQTSLERRIKHYSNFHPKLLFGRGDCSFSSVLTKAFGSAKNMVSTSLDGRDKTMDKRDGFRSHRDNALKEKENIAKQSAEALRLKEYVTIVEFESERKARIDAESARDETLKERNEFKRQKDEALQEKTKVTRQLAEALRLKEDAINQRDLSMLNHKLERQARKAAEKAVEAVKEQARKAAETEREYLKDLHNKERKAKMNNLLSQKENACREKEKIAKQLDEVLRLEDEKINGLQRQRDDALSQKENACREKEEIAKELDGVLRMEAEKISSLEKQRDDALSQKEIACREKTEIAKQLEATKKREIILREQHERDRIVYWIVLGCDLIIYTAFFNVLYNPKKMSCSGMWRFYYKVHKLLFPNSRTFSLANSLEI